MLAYIGRRALLAVFTVWAISVLSFVIIQLPPGDYVSSYIAQMASMGSVVSDEEAQALRIQYGLGQPIYVQYWKWMKQIAEGNFGFSMVPNFLLALVILYFGFTLFNAHIGGLFSPELQDAPWSWARAWDLLKHLPIPALILGLAGTAQQIRIMRANLLDELRKPYVVTARSKGLPEQRVIVKYPVRMALNPFASTIGYTLPYIVSGSIIVSLVLGLPTVGPLLLKALISQDMFLAGTIVLLLGVMTVIGTLISDILLVWIDPRIRLEDT